MSTMELREPLQFTPIFQEKIWGGQAFRSKLGKSISQGTIGESWEISGYGDEQTVVVNGSLKGYTLGQIMKMMPDELLGANVHAKSFPLLYKFIDANDNLSVQVHPDDAQAQAHGWGEYGKTECWYVVDAKEDAQITVGFKKNVTRNEVNQAIESSTLDNLLNNIHISAGDVLFIPAGTVHAILDGTLIYEVQETSDTTLRLYDYGRTDSAGKPRDLHVNDALQVLDTMAHNRHRIEPVVIDQNGYKHSYRVACKYFAIEQFTMFRDIEISLPIKQSFSVITVIGEPIQLVYEAGEMSVLKGQSVLIPAALKDVKVEGQPGSRLLLSSIPDLKNEIIAPLKALGVPRETIALLGGNPQRNDLIPLL